MRRTRRMQWSDHLASSLTAMLIIVALLALEMNKSDRLIRAKERIVFISMPERLTPATASRASVGNGDAGSSMEDPASVGIGTDAMRDPPDATVEAVLSRDLQEDLADSQRRAFERQKRAAVSLIDDQSP